ncbi:MAG: ATP-dependent Clp protease ATP-binding subunit [Candidatus Omnitrophica bacterium]|nr:ATP-dependent Clp protease ATP-binding subunit [Candidatus Omnitrophota bacterium]
MKFFVKGTEMQFNKGAETIVNKARKLSPAFSHVDPPVNYELTFLAFADLKHLFYIMLSRRFSLCTPAVKNLLHGYIYDTKEDEPTEENWKKEEIFFKHVEKEAKDSDSVVVCEEHILRAIFKYRDKYNGVLKLFEDTFGIKQECLVEFARIIKHVDAIMENRKIDSSMSFFEKEAIREAQKCEQAKPYKSFSNFREKTLDKYGSNLNLLAEDGKFTEIVGREKEITAVEEVLLRQGQNNVILIGQPGVGKTAIVDGLADRIVKGKASERLKSKKIIEINLGGLIAGTTLRGQFEERIQKILEECKDDENIILFLSDIHQMIGAGGEGVSSAANLFKPALLRGQLCCIGTTTISDYQKQVEKDTSLARGFEVIRIDEPNIATVHKILQNAAGKYSEYHQVPIDNDAVEAAIDISSKYIKDRCLPGKALSLLDRAASRVSLSEVDGKNVDANVIAQIVSDVMRIPVNQILFSQEKIFLDLEDKLKKKVHGQDEAIRRIVDVIQLTKYEMDIKPQRPDGVFLIVGSTGTGKTELAKALAESLLGSESQLLRFDMSEFMEKHNASKLIGSPPGYQGSEEGGVLTNVVKANPYSVILFDEVEKSHPDVLRLFLQMFDDGRLTDAKGETVSFSFATIIMTSNLGVKNLKESDIKNIDPDKIQSYIKVQIEPEIKKFFAPEFLNRLDDILYFNFLSEEVIKKIAKQKIDQVIGRLKEKGKEIIISEDIYNYIITQGFSVEYGGRFLNRAIQDVLLRPLTKYSLEHPQVKKLRCDFNAEVKRVEIAGMEDSL